MPGLPNVDVLLATYNGAAYLAEQLDSVLAQRGVALRILIRDDGSSDATLQLIGGYVERHPGKIILLQDNADRLGASGNFLRLLARDSDAEYFAFCDQDDVWPVDKLEAAVTQLQAVGKPLSLYCAAVAYVDHALQPIGQSAGTVRPAFANALAENIAPGCTMVMDAALRQLIASRLPQQATIHDWWAYLVATAFGQVVYDPVPRILYRQHGGNTVGGGFSFTEKWRKRLRRFRDGKAWKMAAQATELGQLFPGRLTPAQQELIRYFVAGKTSFAARLRFLLGWRVWRQSPLETLVVKVLVLINAY